MECAKREDERLADILSSDLDPLLLFVRLLVFLLTDELSCCKATLFSAILAAFLIEVRKGLEEDLQDVTNTLLTQVIATLSGTPQPGSSASFAPTLATRSVNALWFLSLMFSLMSALGASIAKGWITQFSLADPGLYWTNVEAHITRLAEIQRFHVKWIIQSLSLLMHIAFFLFAIGLSQLLFTDDFFIGVLIAVLTGFVFILYIGNTVHPIVSAASPFRTPLTGMLRQVFRRSTIPGIEIATVLPPTTEARKAHALAWLMKRSLDSQVVRAAIRATAGLPHQPDVQKELLLAPVI
ncbi:hypothetical protein C8R45DRAFT_849922 [Mycena sanguinolenta]|nr:hypothetical protein C8R45DRAFT_849922 [Mycena sanguinolenta]